MLWGKSNEKFHRPDIIFVIICINNDIVIKITFIVRPSSSSHSGIHDHHLDHHDRQVKGIECYCGGGGCSSSQVSVHSCCQSAVSWGLFPARLRTYNFPTLFQKMFTIPHAQYSPIYDVHSTEYSFGCNRRWLGLASMSALFLVQPSLPAQWNDIQHSIFQLWWKQSFLL